MNEKDTTKSAQQVLINIYRKMPVKDKASRIFDACQTGKILAMAGLRQLHPEATEKQIWKLWAKNHLGQKLFNAAYGDRASD